MITKVEIVDNNNTPLSYISNLKAFKNGTSFDFKSGINIIIGKNGCGKSSLIKLLSLFLLCDDSSYSKIKNDTLFSYSLFKENFGKDTDVLLDGIKIKSDYCGVVYNYITHKDISENNILSDIGNFSNYVDNVSSSTGESMVNSLNYLFNTAFSNRNIQFPIQELINKNKIVNEYWQKRIRNLLNYYKENSIKVTEKSFEYTFLLDEPDRNLDITNIEQLFTILSYKKPMTQLICVIHNPILIYKLSKLDYVNFIELTAGYLNDIKNVFKTL